MGIFGFRDPDISAQPVAQGEAQAPAVAPRRGWSGCWAHRWPRSSYHELWQRVAARAGRRAPRGGGGGATPWIRPSATFRRRSTSSCGRPPACCPSRRRSGEAASASAGSTRPCATCSPRAVEELADPALGFVTVTGVDVTADLEHAVVRVSVLGGERSGREAALRALDRAEGVLQSRVARELHLRRTPVLTFQYDEGVDRAMRINELLDDAGSSASEGEADALNDTMTDADLTRDLEDVVAAIAAADRVLVASHENPDGDAIGSLAACKGALQPAGQAGAAVPPPGLADPARVRVPRPGRARADARPRLARRVDAARRRLRQRAPAGARPRRGARALRRASSTSTTTTTTAATATPTWSTAARRRPPRSWPRCSTGWASS